jgi:hypothetical protein
MTTESFQEYKGYIIRLRASTNGGFGYAIIKQIESKKLYLRKQMFAFIEPDKLLFKAKSYIDNFEDVLIKKYNKMAGGDQ